MDGAIPPGMNGRPDKLKLRVPNEASTNVYNLPDITEFCMWYAGRLG